MSPSDQARYRKAWRDRVVEAPLDPSLPIVDAHHHLWDASPTAKFDPFNVEEFRAEIEQSGHNVVATVEVDSHSYYRADGPAEWRSLGEAEHMDGLATRSEQMGASGRGICAAIVTNVDLRLGKAAGPILDAHIAASPRHLRGIRSITAHDRDDPNPFGNDPGILLRSDFRDGFAELAPRGLTFDASPLHPQLPELVDLARCFPETPIIIDHAGKPLKVGRYAGRPLAAMAEWSASIGELARCANVFIKLGGFNMDADLALSTERPPTSEQAARTQQDYILKAIELFGPQRCMFESNFPVDRIGISYGVLWNAFKRITADFTADERDFLFWRTAASVYRIETVGDRLQ